MDDRPGYDATPQPGDPTGQPQVPVPPSAPAPVQPPQYAYVPPVAPVAPVPQPVAPERPRERTRGGAGRVFIGAVIGGIIGAVLVGSAVFMLFLPLSRSTTVTPSTQPAPVTTSATLTQPVEAAAAKVLPSVVNIAIEQAGGSGVGSGVIISQDGYILTNNHVVEGATRLTVRLGTTDVAARVIGTDPTSDLAVIKVAKTGLPAATLGDSASLRVGEAVLAIGSPFGLDKTVTTGIVSALHRTNLQQGATGITAYTNLIQTDAAINPGNSGGALADISGAVVGINALIQSPSGQLGAAQSSGIGFAIPIDFAKSIADQLIAGKTITHPYMGISSVTVTPVFAQQYGLSVDSGALVQQVSPGSPAASAGIRVGDIIVRIGDQTIAGSEDVFTSVRGATVGTPVAVELVRDGANVTVNVTLIAR